MVIVVFKWILRCKLVWIASDSCTVPVSDFLQFWTFWVTLGTFELLVLLDQCLNISHIKMYFSYLYLTACRIMLSSILYFVEWTDYDTYNECHGTYVIVQSACRNVPSRRGTLVDNYCACVCFVESACHLTHASRPLITTLVFCRINIAVQILLRQAGWVTTEFVYDFVELSCHLTHAHVAASRSAIIVVMFCGFNLSQLIYVHFAARRFLSTVELQLSWPWLSG